MLIDTHCHLTDNKFDQVDEVIGRAKEAGVEKMIIPGTDLNDSRLAIELAEKHKGVYALAGIHPEQVQEISNLKFQISKLQDLIQCSDRVVGVGEIGLDFYWREDNKKKQIEIFKAQLEFAVELDLPVVIHNREAEEEMMVILEKMSKMPRGQFHCWSGSEMFLRWVLDRGFYVSFAGNVTFREAENLRERLRMVPIEKLLLETDSPLLAPEPVRGTQNEPKNVKILAEFQAKLLEVSVETLIAETGKNALCLFSGIS